MLNNVSGEYFGNGIVVIGMDVSFTFHKSHHFFKFENILIQHSAVLSVIYKLVTVCHSSHAVELNVGDVCFCRFQLRKTFQYPLPLTVVLRPECTPRNAIHYGNSQPRSLHRSSLDLT